jgi:amino acid transporter
LGWNEILFNKPASTGALAVIFADALATSAGASLPSPLKALGACLVVLAIGMINIRGVRWGAAVQNATTWIKAGFLAFIGLLPFALLVFGVPAVSWDNYQSVGAVPNYSSFSSRFGVALLAVMWAYNGWHAITPIAEEIKKPRRNVARAILLGIGILMALYLMANIAYHGVLSMEEVAASGEQPAVEMLRKLLGPVGAPLMGAILMCSVFGAINSDLMVVPRVSFAMGRDGVFFGRFAEVHRKFRTPATAILIQAMLSVSLIVASAIAVEVVPNLGATSIFELLTNFAIFSASIFYVMAVMAVPILRWREPTARRPFRAWGYPATPFLFFAVYLWFLGTILFARPVEAGVGVGLIALGVPAYLFFAGRRNKKLMADL